MRYNRKLFFRLLVLLLALFVSDVLGVFFYNLHIKKVQAKNAVFFQNCVYELTYQDDQIEHDLEVLNKVLELKHLDYGILGQTYMLISTLHYTAGDMQSFFSTVGHALFYLKKTNDTESIVYLYANMAKFFLEIGEESKAYEIVQEAEKLVSFYDCQNFFTKIQIMQVYARYLITKGEFEEAARAADCIIAEADAAAAYNSRFGIDYVRDGEILKALALLEQGKNDEAYNAACSLYDEFYNPDEDVSQFAAFDFYLPVFYIKTICSLEKGEYEQAFEFNNAYGSFCDEFFFTMLKIRLSTKVLEALPSGRYEDLRISFYRSIGDDSQKLSENLLSDYSYLCNDKFETVENNLEIKRLDRENRREMIKSMTLRLFFFLFIVLLIFTLYSETKFDALTKIRNRRSLNEKLKRLTSFNHNYYAIMIDLDNFKKLNDTYGHDFGDLVLQKTADTLLKIEKKGVKAYRYGGEEFVVILEKLNLVHAVKTAELIRYEISNLKWDNDAVVTASLGVGNSSENDAIKQADINMYYAKRLGKNFVAYEKSGKTLLAERRIDIRNK